MLTTRKYQSYLSIKLRWNNSAIMHFNHTILTGLENEDSIEFLSLVLCEYAS